MAAHVFAGMGNQLVGAHVYKRAGVPVIMLFLRRTALSLPILLCLFPIFRFLFTVNIKVNRQLKMFLLILPPTYLLYYLK